MPLEEIFKKLYEAEIDFSFSSNRGSGFYITLSDNDRAFTYKGEFYSIDHIRGILEDYVQKKVIPRFKGYS